jgi:hypothetical protein
MPEDGLFMACSPDPAGKWTLNLVQDVANWKDQCPFCDDDGQAYLLHGKVGAGPVILNKMPADGKKLLNNGTQIYRNDKKQPTLESFKFIDKRAATIIFRLLAGRSYRLVVGIQIERYLWTLRRQGCVAAG